MLLSLNLTISYLLLGFYLNLSFKYIYFSTKI